MPFAFLIEKGGVIASNGLVSHKRHLGFVMDQREFKPPHAETKRHENHVSDQFHFVSVAQEIGHD